MGAGWTEGEGGGQHRGLGAWRPLIGVLAGVATWKAADNRDEGRADAQPLAFESGVQLQERPALPNPRPSFLFLRVAGLSPLTRLAGVL